MATEQVFTVHVRMLTSPLADPDVDVDGYLRERSEAVAGQHGTRLVGDTWIERRCTYYRPPTGLDETYRLVECAPGEAEVVQFDLRWRAEPLR